jgi:hypothetical protein
MSVKSLRVHRQQGEDDQVRGLFPLARSAGKTLLIENCEKRCGERVAFPDGPVPVSATANDRVPAARGASKAPSEAGFGHHASYGERAIPLAAFVGALVVPLMRPTNLDVSWLLTVNERILAGATPYHDVIELNPPASILLYRIPVLVAKLLPLPSQWILIVLFALLVGGILAYATSILTRYQLNAGTNHSVFLVVAALVFAVLPVDEMAQREHFATLFMFPYAIVAIARASGKKIGWADGLVSGIMLGLSIAIKPHFVLCALLVAGFEFARSREIRGIFRIEHWSAGAIVLAYFVSSLVFFPKFFSDILPMVTDLYLPLRIRLPELIRRAVTPILIPLCICWLFHGRRQNSGIIVFLLVGAGFLVAFLIQGKGWNYHLYPAIAFFLMAAGWALQGAEREEGRFPRKLGFALMAAALILPAPRFFRPDVSHPGLEATIERLAPHPRILTIGFLQNLGHPLTRDVGGVWVGRTWGEWATGGALAMMDRAGDDQAKRAKALAYFEGDRQMLTEDIETQHPDVILLEETAGFDFQQWIAQSPRLQAAMAQYRRAETVDGVEIYQPRNGASG